MVKAFAIVFFGLAPTFLGATAVPAAQTSTSTKTIDMGYIDQTTITRACQDQLGAVPFTGGENYGCSSRDIKITCDQETCTASGHDLTPVVGNSLQAVIGAMDQRAGERILPLDARIEPVNGRTQP
jgi:hypothetical protein